MLALVIAGPFLIAVVVLVGRLWRHRRTVRLLNSARRGRAT